MTWNSPRKAPAPVFAQTQLPTGQDFLEGPGLQAWGSPRPVGAEHSLESLRGQEQCLIGLAWAQCLGILCFPPQGINIVRGPWLILVRVQASWEALKLVVQPAVHLAYMITGASRFVTPASLQMQVKHCSMVFGWL